MITQLTIGGAGALVILVIVMSVAASLVLLAGAAAYLVWRFTRKNRDARTTQQREPGSSPRVCLNCGSTLPPDAPQGLCPRCVFKQGLATEPAQEAAVDRSVQTAAPSIAAVSQHLPQFELLELIGHGGMGAVYKARQRNLDRVVALKVLSVPAGSNVVFEERFGVEARLLARINHPHIVTIYDFGQAGPFYYFAMEYVEGSNLRQLLAKGRLSPDQALTIVPQICEALQHAHRQGIVHRDIKPENILIDREGRVKIADFGLAKLLGKIEGVGRLTQARDIMGTPHYMAPEQATAPQEVDHRADIYSLGVVFYEMLTGDLPVGRFPPPSSKAGGVQVDVRLDEVVLKALEKEPSRRYQNVAEVKTDVDAIRSGAGASEIPPVFGSRTIRFGDDPRSVALRRLRIPAIGLLVSSISGPFMLGFLVTIGRMEAGAWMFWPLVIELALIVVAAYGSLKALALEQRQWAIAGGVAGCVVSFLNFFCLPFAIWLLAVLTRSEVKRAFATHLPAEVKPEAGLRL